MAKAKSKAKKKKRPQKTEKIKLTKQQKIRVAQMIRLENRISQCREFIQLWAKFFQFFADDIHERKIEPADEKAFFTAITLLARRHFLFTELMGEAFEGSAEVMDVLVASVSLSNIKAMDESTYSKLELDWHTLFLNMNVAMGRLLRKMPAGMKINEMIQYAEAQAKGQGNGGGAGGDSKSAKPKKKKFLGFLRKAKA